MIGILIQNEWLLWWRDRNIRGSFLALLIIAGIALWHQVDFQSSLIRARVDAKEKSREEWLKQDPKHPHVAAHFGNYAYKRPLLLHCFDPGLTMYTGTSVYMEPHRQNDFLFSKGQESDTGIRFGWLSPALICQLVFPLFIVLLSFNAVNGERQRGTMPLLLTQGLSFRTLMIAKISASFILLEVLFTCYLVITCLVTALAMNTGIDMPAVLYIWLTYTFYILFWTTLTVAVSARTKLAGNAIALLLLIWMFSCVLIPRIASNLSENIFPLTTNYEFKRAVAEDVANGLNGHDTSSDRAKRLESELLKKYNVDDVKKLPFNFEGYIMQQAEDYSSKVYDVHFASIFHTLRQQKQLQAWFGIVSPFISLRDMSMAATHASLESEIDFQVQAETHRRKFVQEMNNDMMNNSAYGSFDTYHVKKDIYQSIPDVEITTRSFSWAIGHVIIDNILLVLWTLVMLNFILFQSRKPVYS